VHFAEIRVPVMLDKERFLIFDANAMEAYEEATGKFFLDTVASLYEAMRPVVEMQQKKLKVSNMQLTRHIPVKFLRALVWATCIEYDKDDTPSWPFTLNQMGRVLLPHMILPVFTAFLKGASANSPTTAELGESQALPKANGTQEEQTEADGGGEPSIDVPASAFV